jgi:hypothetical protein
MRVIEVKFDDFFDLLIIAYAYNWYKILRKKLKSET